MSFSPLVEKMCDLTEVMIDKTKLQTAFKLCHHKDSLPSILKKQVEC